MNIEIIEPNLNIVFNGYKNIIAMDMVNIQPLMKPFSISSPKKHWEIKKSGHRWILERWTDYNFFTLSSPTHLHEWFDTEEEAIQVMMLEKFEE
jgi:hypothetical protein